jgi:hypothetical protein
LPPKGCFLLLTLKLLQITKAGVPSSKVVVGVSSYGRSFAMADASCHTSDCLFTGTAVESNAAEGPCTGTPGYISDAEIYDIINGNASPLGTRQSRVNQDYVDTASNSRIIVYDDTQWVAFMDDDIRIQRAALYQGLSMGGTTNWASDLETYNEAPNSGGSWNTFVSNVMLGVDPYIEGERTGNWVNIDCNDQSIEDLRGLTPQQRWSMMDGANAWADVLEVWKIDQVNGMKFTQSVAATINAPQQADCGTLLGINNCDQTLQCNGFIGSGSGAAGYEIWNSMVFIHEVRARESFSASFKSIIRVHKLIIFHPDVRELFRRSVQGGRIISGPGAQRL